MVGFRSGKRVVGLKVKGIMEEADQFLRNDVQLIEREFFDFVEYGGVGDDDDIEGVGDGRR